MTDNVTRRSALGLGLTTAGFAVASCSARVAAHPADQTRATSGGPHTPSDAPAPHDVVKLGFDAAKLEGLSKQLLTLHHAKNYGGAVKKLNLIRGKLLASDPSQSGSYWSEFGTLKAGEAAARNSALLHELYFGNLVGPGQSPPSGIGKALVQRFGSVDAAVDRMKACGKATSGWVILTLDRSSKTIEIVPTAGHRGGAWHAEPLIVLDVFEHSYALDYGPDKGSYLNAFFNNLDWTEVGKRFDTALTLG